MGYYAEAAKRAEDEHRWLDAYVAWRCEGGEYAMGHANACKTIATATELGDQFREKIEDAYKKLMEHKLTIYDYMETLRVAHSEVYNR